MAATSAGTASGYADATATGIAAAHVGDQRRARRMPRTAPATSQPASTQLAGGIDQSASGAQALSSGASQLAGGADQLVTGAQSLADGVQRSPRHRRPRGRPADGHRSSRPTRTPRRRASPTVVADPVDGRGVGTSLFGASAIPLLATLALWFGGLATFVALQAVSRRALTSRAPSVLLALRGFAPAAALGAAQGLLVAVVVQLAASYEWAYWSVFAGICDRRGHRLRRGEPGARRGVRRRGTLDLGADRRARRRDRRGLDGARGALGRRRAHADRARLQRHGRRAHVDIRRRSGARRTRDLGGAVVRRDDPRGGPSTDDLGPRATAPVPVRPRRSVAGRPPGRPVHPAGRLWIDAAAQPVAARRRPGQLARGAGRQAPGRPRQRSRLSSGRSRRAGP